MRFNDIFKEQLIEVKRSWKTTAKKTIVIVVSIAVGGLAMILGGAFIGPMIILGLVFGSSYLIKAMNLEYEYILTNNDLDIDKIMNKERRKECFTVDVKEMDFMVHIDNELYKSQMDQAEKSVDVSSGEKCENTYVILFHSKGKRVKMIFEPNEEIQQGIFKQAPSKVHL